MKVVITIPAYNEEKTIGKVIRDIKNVMHKTDYNYEIIVVNDGSKDKTKFIAKESGAIVYSNHINLGLSETFKIEIQKCLDLKADIIVHTDADGQYLAKDIPRLIKEVENGNDLVLGNRFMGGIEYLPIIKKLGNKAFSKVISKIVQKKIGDCQTGFRAFTKEVAENIEIISNFTYTQEQIIHAVKKGYKIKEIPTYFAKRESGKSRLFSNPFGYAIRAWTNLFRLYRDYEPLKFFSMFGFLFIFTGSIIGFWFVFLHITKGIQGHLGLMMLMFLLIIVGIQIFLFGFLADMQRNRLN
ncbi:MAG TPA: glycosyltransferase family 2 protein [Candidatus Nanoarchaeia archaeon]|nr:glycosyltransferase family 2 protein [Candidatus Nanoarchaeia archaeon]